MFFNPMKKCLGDKITEIWITSCLSEKLLFARAGIAQPLGFLISDITTKPGTNNTKPRSHD